VAHPTGLRHRLQPTAEAAMGADTATLLQVGVLAPLVGGKIASSDYSGDFFLVFFLFSLSVLVHKELLAHKGRST
jgi:uncharacterized membrane protein (DUF441 family)